MEDNSWLDETQIRKAGYSVEELMERSHEISLLPRQPDAGASGRQGEDRERANTISEEDWER